MSSGTKPLQAAGLCAFGFGYLLWRFWQPTTPWLVGVLIFGALGFPMGWLIEPLFVSRQRRYQASPVRQVLDRILMGIGIGSGLGLVGGLIATGVMR
jgi:hypothetical protein